MAAAAKAREAMAVEVAAVVAAASPTRSLPRCSWVWSESAGPQSQDYDAGSSISPSRETST